MGSDILLLLLFGIFCFHSPAFSEAGRSFYVGGRDGWVLNPSEDYNLWAGRNRFQINDTLVFRYKRGEDTVLQVGWEDYFSCNTSSPIATLSFNDDSGSSIFKLAKSGPFFFIGGEPGRCEMGQKLVVVVLADRSLPSYDDADRPSHTFFVGGLQGWAPNPSEDYNHWAGRNRFSVNDSLVFVYDRGEDSVLEVGVEEYKNCNGSSPIRKMSSGQSVVKLDRSGPFYFISGVVGNCRDGGQKLIVVVLAVRGNDRSSGSEPPPMIGAPATSPSTYSYPSPSPSGSPLAPPTQSPSNSSPLSSQSPLGSPSSPKSAVAPSATNLSPLSNPSEAPSPTNSSPLSNPPPTSAEVPSTTNSAPLSSPSPASFEAPSPANSSPLSNPPSPSNITPSSPSTSPPSPIFMPIDPAPSSPQSSSPPSSLPPAPSNSHQGQSPPPSSPPPPPPGSSGAQVPPQSDGTSATPPPPATPTSSTPSSSPARRGGNRWSPLLVGLALGFGSLLWGIS